MALENRDLSFHSPPTAHAPQTDWRLCASVPAKLSELILLGPPLSHFFMFLECYEFVPIPGPLFLAPGIISPRSSHGCLPLIQLPASVAPPLKRLLSDQACWMAFQSSPRISLLCFQESPHHYQTPVGCLSTSTMC